MKKPSTWLARLFASALLLLSIAPTAPVVTTATVAGGAASLGLAPFVTTSSLLALAASTKADAGVIQASGSRLYNASDGGGSPYPGYTLTWSDEFSGTGAVGSTYWDYEVGCSNRNSEQEQYQSGTSNANQNAGNLEIEARVESVGGCSYTSASVITKDWSAGTAKKSFLYGIIEVRAKIPSFTGSWPAIWMQGVTGSWPARGEIDIMEHVGYDPTNVHLGTIWTTSCSGCNFTTQGSFDASVYHKYTLKWTTSRMEFYLDDVQVNSYDNAFTGTSQWPFGSPMYLMLNLAIGGSWGGSGGATNNAAMPAKYYIDYVRYYQ